MEKRKGISAHKITIIGELEDEISGLHKDTLGDLIEWLKDYYNDLVCGRMADGRGMCGKMPKFIRYLEAIRNLNWICPGCKTPVAPDEKYEIINEEIYCENCANEGRFG